MKRLLLILAAISLSEMLMAQTSAGSMMVGGTVYYYHASRQGQTFQTDLNLSPGFGYFVADNLAVGINLGISKNRYDNGQSWTIQSSFGAGPFARYYKYTANEKFAFYGEAGFMAFTGRQDVAPSPETRTSAFSFNISPGFAYFFTDHWALNLSMVGFSMRSSDPDKDVDDDKSSYVTFNWYPSLGVRYHFGN